jgi:hypothetical protein
MLTKWERMPMKWTKGAQMLLKWDKILLMWDRMRTKLGMVVADDWDGVDAEASYSAQ